MKADPSSRSFLIDRLEALDRDREHLHQDIRNAGHDPFDLEAELQRRKDGIDKLEFDL